MLLTIAVDVVASLADVLSISVAVAEVVESTTVALWVVDSVEDSVEDSIEAGAELVVRSSGTDVVLLSEIVVSAMTVRVVVVIDARVSLVSTASVDVARETCDVEGMNVVLACTAVVTAPTAPAMTVRDVVVTARVSLVCNASVVTTESCSDVDCMADVVDVTLAASWGCIASSL